MYRLEIRLEQPDQGQFTIEPWQIKTQVAGAAFKQRQVLTSP